MIRRHCSTVYSSAGTDDAIPEFATTMSSLPKSDFILLMIDVISSLEVTFAWYARQVILFSEAIWDASSLAVEEVL